jgi:hypothetical protein
MRASLQRHGGQIPGVLSGFNRMRFRGTLLRLTSVGGMVHFLTQIGVLLKDFGAYAEGNHAQRRARLESLSDHSGRSERSASMVAAPQRSGGHEPPDPTVASGQPCVNACVQSTHPTGWARLEAGA